MTFLSSIDGRIADADDLGLRFGSTAALYGKGCFTTIAVVAREAFLWEKHWRRLITDAGTLGLDMSSIDERDVFVWLRELLEANGVECGRARISFHERSGGLIWPVGDRYGTTVSIMTAEPHGDVEKDPELSVSPYPINSHSPLAGVKSCNYLENLMVLDDARRKGFDEAVRVNERGAIACVSMGNIFWSNDAKLYTPALTTGCLAGTTREFVIENLECEEIDSAEPGTLQSADQIFLTSAGYRVRRVSAFNGRRLSSADHPIMGIFPA
jgi:branched-chain amino acid aminotransferase